MVHSVTPDPVTLPVPKAITEHHGQRSMAGFDGG